MAEMVKNSAISAIHFGNFSHCNFPISALAEMVEMAELVKCLAIAVLFAISTIAEMVEMAEIAKSLAISAVLGISAILAISNVRGMRLIPEI